ncbi:hypothetical protein ADICEAN_04263 [Cesiribacter andamanensis AMV16]|uniref:Uncharacterized protein n=1 Tax=Cesiribacter andamanensis AMV16 TaxID=1279009 RepID=M7NFL1_9BACT|nr:hypothetical protein ADICEAN_04263 [Cesiribacter andamanensis AMV16]
MQGRHQFQDRKVLEFCLSEHIPENNLYKRLKQVLELDYLYQVTKPYMALAGRRASILLSSSSSA